MGRVLEHLKSIQSDMAYLKKYLIYDGNKPKSNISRLNSTHEVSEYLNNTYFSAIEHCMRSLEINKDKKISEATEICSAHELELSRLNYIER